MLGEALYAAKHGGRNRYRWFNFADADLGPDLAKVELSGSKQSFFGKNDQKTFAPVACANVAIYP